MSIPVISIRGLIIPTPDGVGIDKNNFTSIVFDDEDGITIDLYNNTSSDVTVYVYIDDIQLLDTLGAPITIIIPAQGGLSYRIYWNDIDPAIRSQILTHGYHTIEIRDKDNGQPYDRVAYLYYIKGSGTITFIDENGNTLTGNLAIIDADKGFYRIFKNVQAVFNKPSQTWRVIYVFWKLLDGEFYYGVILDSSITDTTVKLYRTKETFLHIQFKIHREKGIKGLLQLVGWTWASFLLERDILPLMEFICRRLGLPLYSIDFSYDDQYLYVTLVIRVTREDFGSWVVRAVIIGGLILLIVTIVTAGYIIGVWTSSQAVISRNETIKKISDETNKCVQSCLEDESLTSEQKMECIEACTSFSKSLTSTLQQPPPAPAPQLPEWFWTILAIIILIGLLTMLRR